MLEPGTDLFYSDLPCVSSFEAVTKITHFTSVPPDWIILVADIKGSTAAIRLGRYKEVNFVGASVIAAVLNAVGRLDIPFVFGGDGATLLIPPSCLDVARAALLSTQRYGRLAFGLLLRVGIVPVMDVLQANHQILVAKQGLFPGSSQAHFLGGGLAYATQLAKDDNPSNPYQIWETGETSLKLNLDGLECRWQDLPGQPREIVNLIVIPLGSQEQRSNVCYQDTMKVLLQLHGTADNFRPVHPRQLKLTFNPRKLMVETRMRAGSSRWRDRLKYLASITAQNGLGWLLMTQGWVAGGVDWGRYRTDVANTVDYCKIDDALRMVIASDRAQTNALIVHLEESYRAGKLLYGIHRTDRALMTCVVFDRNGRQMHFVDGADGGYALAAEDLKQRQQQSSNVQALQD